jgi:outer membrane receptor protein involved in Fe transport
MKQKIFIFLVSFLAYSGSLLAQDRSITGVVKDEGGQAIPGVSVVLKGTNKGTTTNVDGAYQISASSGTLLFTSIGYASTEASIGSGSVIDIVLKSDDRLLSEVVVTAFGITKDQKVLSYATQQINTGTIAKARELNVANSLIGRVAGLDVARSASGLGGSSRVVLRGDRSITGNNQALIVVDGVPMDNSNFSPGNANGGRDGSDGLSSINPDDIESITVLRGASPMVLC